MPAVASASHCWRVRNPWLRALTHRSAIFPHPAQFLEMIQYNVSISASLYASYYFELRTLCEKAERAFTLKPLSEEQQRALELRANAKVEQLTSVSRHKSAMY